MVPISIIESKGLINALWQSFNAMIKPENSYQVKLTEEGYEWHSDEQVLTDEAASSMWQRIMFSLAQLLPLSSQL